MSIQIVKLQTLINNIGNENTQNILQTFKSKTSDSTSEPNDVEFFSTLKSNRI